MGDAMSALRENKNTLRLNNYIDNCTIEVLIDILKGIIPEDFKTFERIFNSGYLKSVVEEAIISQDKIHRKLQKDISKLKLKIKEREHQILNRI